MRSPMNYAIRLAKEPDVASLPEIEKAAAQQFLPYLEWLQISPDILEGLVSRFFLLKAQSDSRLWVALAEEDQLEKPVGFIVVKFLPESCFVVELDVHPEYGRRGIGSALMETCCRGARDRGFTQVILTTFRKVPWNIPFYQQAGFEVLPEAAWSQDIRAIVDHEARYGFAREKRVVMRRELPPLASGFLDEG